MNGVINAIIEALDFLELYDTAQNLFKTWIKYISDPSLYIYSLEFEVEQIKAEYSIINDMII